jgi:hypothetical protein
MKKLAAGFLAITLIFSASLCWAAYVIHLKDGRNITTHEYWEEGDRIKFKQYGGVIGIQKDLVRGIDEIEDVEELPDGKEIEKRKEAEKQVGAEGVEKAKAATRTKEQENALKKEVFLEDKRQITIQREVARKAYREAKAKNEKVLAKQHYQELISLRNEIKKLEEKVKAAFGGELPDWWRE